MKKFRIILAIMLASFAVTAVAAPSGASAHYVISASTAQFYGQNIAANDCLSTGAPGWHCYVFPVYNSVYAASDHTWSVYVGWKIQAWFGAVDMCVTKTNWSHGVQTYHSNDCLGSL